MDWGLALVLIKVRALARALVELEWVRRHQELATETLEVLRLPIRIRTRIGCISFSFSFSISPTRTR